MNGNPLSGPAWAGILAGWAVSCVLRGAALSRSVPAEGVPYLVQSGLQYAYAERASRGEPAPELDRRAQWPEGLRPRAVLTSLSEEAVGRAWRLLPEAWRPPFRRWTVLASAASSGLAAACSGLLAWALTGSAWAALLASLWQALSLASLLRASVGFEHEHFALPLLGLAVWALIRAQASPRRGGSAGWGLVSGILLGASLLAWHQSRFFWGAWAASLAAASLGLPGAGRGDLAPAVAAFNGGWLAVLAMGGSSHAGADLPASWPALVSTLLGLVLARCGRSGRPGEVPWGPTGVAAWGLFLASAVCFVLGPEQETDFGYVWEMAWASLVGLGAGPGSSDGLPLDARLVRFSQFLGATPGQWLHLFGPLLLLAAGGLLWGLARGWTPVSRPDEIRPESKGRSLPSNAFKVLSLLALAMVAGTWIWVRLAPAAFLFLAPLGAALVREVVQVPGRRLVKVLVVCLVAAGLLSDLQEALFAARYGTAFQFAGLLQERGRGRAKVLLPEEDARRVVDWIGRNLPPDSVVLSYFALSGGVYASGRAAVLPPKVEHRSARLKLTLFLMSLYGPPEGLVALCRRWKATHLVLQEDMVRDEGPDGLRAMTGAGEVRPGCAVRFLLEGPPGGGGRLGRAGFREVFRSGPFRLFEVL